MKYLKSIALPSGTVARVDATGDATNADLTIGFPPGDGHTLYGPVGDLEALLQESLEALAVLRPPVLSPERTDP